MGWHGGTSKGAIFWARRFADGIEARAQVFYYASWRSPDERQLMAIDRRRPLASKSGRGRKVEPMTPMSDYLFCRCFVDQAIVTDAQQLRQYFSEAIARLRLSVFGERP